SSLLVIRRNGALPSNLSVSSGVRGVCFTLSCERFPTLFRLFTESGRSADFSAHWVGFWYGVSSPATSLRPITAGNRYSVKQDFGTKKRRLRLMAGSLKFR